MIIAELRYDQHYSEVHDSLVDVLAMSFDRVESGLQGDSWVWIYRDNEKVSVDSFSAMTHQVKAGPDSTALAEMVVQVLATRFRLEVFPRPVPEPHEE